MVAPLVGIGIAGIGLSVLAIGQAHRIASMQLQAQAMSLETQTHMGRIQSAMQKDMLKANQQKNKTKLDLEKYFLKKSKETNTIQTGLLETIIEQNSSLADLSAIHAKSKAYGDLAENYYSFVNRGFTLSSGDRIYRKGVTETEKYYQIEEFKRQAVKQEQKSHLYAKKHNIDLELLQKEARLEQQIIDDDMNYLSATMGINAASNQQQMSAASSSVHNTARNVANNWDTISGLGRTAIKAAELYYTYKDATSNVSNTSKV